MSCAQQLGGLVRLQPLVELQPLAALQPLAVAPPSQALHLVGDSGVAQQGALEGQQEAPAQGALHRKFLIMNDCTVCPNTHPVW